MRFLGVDPDLHNTGVALIERTGDGPPDVLWVGVARVSIKLKGSAAVGGMVSSLRELKSGLCGLPGSLGNRLWGSAVWDVAVVEGQEVYQGSPVKIADILNLSQVAGIAAGVFAGTPLSIPRPKDWKGQVPKAIHQARVCKKLGWTGTLRGGKEPYVTPVIPAVDLPIGEDTLKESDWKHVMDAIGLALWASENVLTAKGCAA